MTATPTPLPELTPELLRRCGMAAAKVMLTGCEDGAPLRAALEAYREEAIRALRQGGEARPIGYLTIGKFDGEFSFPPTREYSFKAIQSDLGEGRFALYALPPPPAEGEAA